VIFLNSKWFLFIYQLRSRLREYGLITPISTDSHGHFLSHLLSANHKQRVKREVGTEGSEQASDRLFFNITVFGRDFHLRLRPNDRLVSPGAMVECSKNGSELTSGGTERILRRRLLKTDCTFIGDITDVKGASVAINNCDGLVNSHQPLTHTHIQTLPPRHSTL
uniref:Peptidase M12B propeptide domain-containing protein n=1 Tax=Hucho hucho TaxID=62062 RepID=A0A4W5JEW9_9TELE